eukprot:CAMPEP_0171480414 /NCGR_PEP_ID=MMETSP0946-20130122/6047_2 /TAXON_ID=109269 /ORGANISM="Vaucheria litorea, Strain CCMP2940" /LENGTH=112 /DNA_ID=CAMNT_0012011613 /DNA_START=148 /DNA_END=486 /DNA_ORIENTATION=-
MAPASKHALANLSLSKPLNMTTSMCLNLGSDFTMDKNSTPSITGMMMSSKIIWTVLPMFSVLRMSKAFAPFSMGKTRWPIVVSLRSANFEDMLLFYHYVYTSSSIFDRFSFD